MQPHTPCIEICTSLSTRASQAFGLLTLNRLVRKWFKGADSTILSLFLEEKFTLLLDVCDPDVQGHVRTMAALFKHANIFMTTLYHSDVFLTPAERTALIESGRCFLKLFAKCASYSFLTLNLTRFKFQPKYHFLAEIVFKLECQQQAGVISMNPILESTQVDEDFVGRVAKFSREVSVRLIHLRTLKKYLLSLASLW